jgi:hypothetical protein
MDTTKVAPKVQDLAFRDNVAHLEYGRELYVTRCTKCHNALRITRYTKGDWEDILPEMTFKSKFSEEQKQAVTAYIHAVLLSSTATTN